MTRRGACLLLAMFTAACGQSEELAGASASLLVPRQLAERLRNVEVFLFKTANNRPYCEELNDPLRFADLRPAAFLTEQIDFTQGNVAILEGIPDYGRIWRFYARGYDLTANMIAQGCNEGLYLIEAGKTALVEIILTAYP